MWNLKYNTNKFTYIKVETHRHRNKLMGTKGQEGRDKLRVWD